MARRALHSNRAKYTRNGFQDMSEDQKGSAIDHIHIQVPVETGTWYTKVAK